MRMNGWAHVLRMAGGGAVALALVFSFPVMAEEGMWTFDNLPLELLEEQYGFAPTGQWLDKVRLSSVRFMDGGSGAFVSPRGLVVTNHHVGMGQLQKMSTAELDYVAGGYLAGSPADEIPCKDLEVNITVHLENVTSKVLGAVRPEMSKGEAQNARDAEASRIEKESLDQTGLRSEVVNLYRGGEYWLYRYLKYTDVRLVFAPELQAAMFGGESDNFTYPRHGLDVAFFRVYEDGQPLATEHYLTWNAEGAKEEELVLVPGHPGSTNRLFTVAQLEYRRDVTYPARLNFINRTIEALGDYAARGKEQRRRGLPMIFGFSNAMKAMEGEYEALLDRRLMAGRRDVENEFRASVDGNPVWQSKYGTAWKSIEAAYGDNLEMLKQVKTRSYFGLPFTSRLVDMALKLVFYVEEVEKPDAERLDGYNDAGLEELKFRLFSPAPVHRDLEQVMIQLTLEYLGDRLGADDPMVKVLSELGDPRAAAETLAGKTRLDDVEFRKQLLEGGREAVAASDDPLIVIARGVAPILRQDQLWEKLEVESVVTPASEQIARARFDVYGKTTYPDGTFTLRLTYGAVRGYPMNGTRAPHMTTLYGLFDRSLGFGNKGEWELPQRFWDRMATLDLSTPVNFISDCDTTGGNSGSPVINREAELVGLLFDGNIESLSGKFLFDEQRNRSIAVHSAYIMEALRKLYDAGHLADELLPQK